MIYLYLAAYPYQVDNLPGEHIPCERFNYSVMYPPPSMVFDTLTFAPGASFFKFVYIMVIV